MRPQNLDAPYPRNVLGVIFWGVLVDGCGSLKYLGAVDPGNISRMWFRQIFGGCRPPKYLTDGVPSNIWRL